MDDSHADFFIQKIWLGSKKVQVGTICFPEHEGNCEGLKGILKYMDGTPFTWSSELYPLRMDESDTNCMLSYANYAHDTKCDQDELTVICQFDCPKGLNKLNIFIFLK